MREYVKTVEGLNIYFEAIEEFIPAQQVFSFKETGVNHHELIQKIIAGQEEYFCAKVSAVSPETGEELAVDFLGACVYTPARSFIKDSGYFDDMVNIVVAEVQKKLQFTGDCNDQKCE